MTETESQIVPELGKIFARGYLRLLKLQKSVAGALDGTANTALSVTNGLTEVSISEECDEH